MAFRKNLSNVYTSPGTIGDAIRRCRELRNLSMKELGIKSGFPVSSADVRIAQYESNKKTPTEESLKAIANTLEMDEETFINVGLLTNKRLFKVFFELERQRGLHPVYENGLYGLRFDSGYEFESKHDYIVDMFMKYWYEMYEECVGNLGLSAEEREAKRKKYEIWKGEFPQQIELEQMEKNRRAREKQDLQERLDRMNEEDHADEKMEDLKRLVESEKSKVLSFYEPIKKLSDLIGLLIKIIENGLPVLNYSNDIQPSDETMWNLFIFKTSDIMQDDEKKLLYTEMVCAIDDLKKSGISIAERIVCRNNEFYIVYQYPKEQIYKIHISPDVWEEMMDIIKWEKDKYYDESVYTRRKEEFIDTIKNKYELYFSPQS